MYRKAMTIAALLVTLGLGSALAQTNTGRISGTVTDSNGAAVPGVAVKIVSDATQQMRTALTESNGFYVATNLPVGTYTITVEQQGFKRATKTGYNLVADGRLTVDFTLETGAVTESVEVVAAAGETVNSTSGEVARVIDQSQVQELALNGRNYMQLTTLIPGAPLLEDNALGLMTSLSVSQPINGNRGNSNLLTVDGGFNLDSGSNGSQINNVGIDFIKEVNIKTSNFSAEYGRNSGAAINVVTKSGTNQFHGSAFEFLRNEKLDANYFFINRTPLTAEQLNNGIKKQPRAPLRYNNFGWSFGGPIIKDRFFFFAGMEWKKIRQFTTPQFRTLPTRAERAGDFSLRLRGPDLIVGTADDGVLRDPTSTLPCTAPVIASGQVTTQANRAGCFPSNIIPANRLTADGKAIAAVYNAMERVAFSFSDVLTGNNTLIRDPNPFNFRQEILRLDFKINEKQNLFGRYLHDDYDLIEPYGTFITSQLPTIPTNRRRPGYSYQVGHTWLLSAALINEARVNVSWNEQRIPPVGDAWKRETYGFTYQQLYTGGGRFENSIPDVTVSGFASFRSAAASLLSPTTDISFSDNITWTRNAHTLKSGLAVIRNRKDQNGRTAYTGNVNFQSGGNPNSTGQAMADALLSNFRTYSEFDSDPIGFFRFTQIEAFASDSWRINRKLSVELGVRYQWGLPTYTTANNIVNFDPAFYDPAKAVTVRNDGTIDVSRGGDRYNGLVRAGAGTPQEELGRVPRGNAPDVLAVPTGSPRGLFEVQHLFAPRFSFAYAPFSDNRTAIRGGFGIFYDRPEGNLIFSSVNIPPFSISQQYENGNLASIAAARASAPAPFSEIFTIAPDLVMPYTMNYSLSIQRELPWGVFGEIAYVGNQARHLLRQPDINQPTFAALLANARLPVAQRLSTNALRPYKGYAQIRMRLSDSTSNYNSLQAYVTKRKGQVRFTTSYTWSKVLSDSSGNGDNPEEPENRRFNYGPTSFDRRHILVLTNTWEVPFFRKSQGWTRTVLGGWEVSTIARFQSGRYFTITGNTEIGGRRADYLGGDTILDSFDKDTLVYLNRAAFAPAPPERRGNSAIGAVEGPGRHVWDFSLRKNFRIKERIGAEFRADLFNTFNRINLLENDAGISTNVSDLNFGTITRTAPPRQAQLSLRLNF